MIRAAAPETQIELAELREAARRFLTDKVDYRRVYDSDCADAPGLALHGAMAELGWLMLAIPEEHGGLGQSFAELAEIYREMGRALAPVSIAESLAAAELLATAPQAATLVRQIAVGDARVAIAFAPVADGPIELSADMVVDGALATHMLVVGETRVAVVDLAGPGVTRIATSMWDRSRGAARVTLAGVPAELVFPFAPDAAAALRCHLDLAFAWDAVGGAERALEEAVAYMQLRQQFGRPIGSFQALKHRAADLKTGLDIAAALTRQATSFFANRRGEWALLGSQARLLAEEAYHAIAEENIQFHGGIGFTWEHDAHLFFKRAWLGETLGGGDSCRDRMAPALFAAIDAGSAMAQD